MRSGKNILPNVIATVLGATIAILADDVASAQVDRTTNFAVITNGPVPFYGGGVVTNVDTQQPIGRFSAFEHLCANWVVTISGRSYVNIIALQNGNVDAAYNRRNFTRDPANDFACQTNADRKLSQDMNKYETEKKAAQDKEAADISKFVVPDTVTDPLLRTDIAAARKYYPGLVADPSASNWITKYNIANTYFNRDARVRDSANERIIDTELSNQVWSAEKPYNDFAMARRWYQRILKQFSSEDVNIWINGHPDFKREYDNDVASATVKIKERIAICDDIIKNSPENRRKTAVQRQLEMERKLKDLTNEKKSSRQRTN